MSSPVVILSYPVQCGSLLLADLAITLRPHGQFQRSFEDIIESISFTECLPFLLSSVVLSFPVQVLTFAPTLKFLLEVVVVIWIIHRIAIAVHWLALWQRCDRVAFVVVDDYELVI